MPSRNAERARRRNRPAIAPLSSICAASCLPHLIPPPATAPAHLPPLPPRPDGLCCAPTPAQTTDIVEYNQHNEQLSRLGIWSAGAGFKNMLMSFTEQGHGYGLLQHSLIGPFLLQLYAEMAHVCSRGSWTCFESRTLPNGTPAGGYSCLELDFTVSLNSKFPVNQASWTVLPADECVPLLFLVHKATMTVTSLADWDFVLAIRCCTRFLPQVRDPGPNGGPAAREVDAGMGRPQRWQRRHCSRPWWRQDCSLSRRPAGVV